MLEKYIGLGVAGNWRNHLEQIGGLKEYSGVNTFPELAPKGLFPWYVENAPGALGQNPLSNGRLQIPAGVDIHPEPEVILECQLEYKGAEVINIVPLAFSVFNDASIRNSDKSVTDKKNFGAKTKGLCDVFTPIILFDDSGILQNYCIASWLKRSGVWNLYSDFCDVKDYKYFYGNLLKWLLNTLNNQHNDGPLEDLPKLLEIAGLPHKALISLGATHYTEFGANNYLKIGDEYLIVLFDKRTFREQSITKELEKSQLSTKSGCLVLHQSVAMQRQE